MILDLRTSRYLQVNPSGTEIFVRLQEGAGAGAAAAALQQRFGVSSERAHADVAAFVADLQRLGLLEP